MRDIIILLGDDLQSERREGAMEVLAQHGTGGTGANLTWQAELIFHEACLRGAEDELSDSIDRILEELHVGGKEAIQADWSFYQHGKRLYSFGYGRSFIDIVVNLGWQVRGTPLEFPKEKQAIISGYLLEGLQWMSRGTYTPPSTIDREISRKHGRTAADLRLTLRRWSEVDIHRSKELKVFLAHQQGAIARPFGHRHFSKGDFTTYHRPSGSIFLKTMSTRTLPTETMGGENKKGTPYLHSGDHYIVRDGNEYSEAPPVWKWNRLPGLTVSEQRTKLVRNDFVGGVSDGNCGLTVMDYQRRTKDRQVVRVRKAWFFCDDMMINLHGDWKTSTENDSIVTSLEQCRLQGPVTFSKVSNPPAHGTLPTGTHLIDNARWVMHQQMGYMPLAPSTMDVSLGAAKGSWSSINSRYNDPADSVTIPMFRIELPYAPNELVDGYAILLGATPEKLDAICKRPTWQVLRNDGQCQAMRFNNGLTMAAFYEAGAVGEGLTALEVNQPCLAMWNEETLWVCDPTNSGSAVELHWKSQQRDLILPVNGDTLSVPAEPIASESPPRHGSHSVKWAKQHGRSTP